MEQAKQKHWMDVHEGKEARRISDRTMLEPEMGDYSFEAQEEKIRSDYLRPIAPGNFGMRSRYWVIGLAIIMGWGLFAYIYQLQTGLEATAMRNYVSWGLYIATFVFIIGISHSGTLVSAILRVTNQEWRRPITRSAELLTAVALMFGGIMPVIDMGRPDRVLNMVFYGRIQSPLMWDILCITTYLTGSVMFLYLPMIPDIALARKHFAGTASKFRLWMYDKLAMGWEGTPAQWRRLERAMRVMTVIIIPIAVSVHTVISYIFAMTPRAGWDSTVFGPYFVVGALYSGSAGVILVMAAFRRAYHLEEYITPRHFDLMGKIVLSLTMIYAYFNLNEYWIPAYKMMRGEAPLLHSLFSGAWSPLFWTLQFGTVLLPIIILATPRGRKPLLATVACIIIVAGAWVKRYVIVIPVFLHPYLPIQNVPDTWANYFPNWVEFSIVGGALAGIFLVITLFSKYFPISSIWEIEEGIHIAQAKELAPAATNSQAATAPAAKEVFAQ